MIPKHAILLSDLSAGDEVYAHFHDSSYTPEGGTGIPSPFKIRRVRGDSFTIDISGRPTFKTNNDTFWSDSQVYISRVPRLEHTDDGKWKAIRDDNRRKYQVQKQSGARYIDISKQVENNILYDSKVCSFDKFLEDGYFGIKDDTKEWTVSIDLVRIFKDAEELQAYLNPATEEPNDAVVEYCEQFYSSLGFRIDDYVRVDTEAYSKLEQDDVSYNHELASVLSTDNVEHKTHFQITDMEEYIRKDCDSAICFFGDMNVPAKYLEKITKKEYEEYINDAAHRKLGAKVLSALRDTLGDSTRGSQQLQMQLIAKLKEETLLRQKLSQDAVAVGKKFITEFKDSVEELRQDKRLANIEVIEEELKVVMQTRKLQLTRVHEAGELIDVKFDLPVDIGSYVIVLNLLRNEISVKHLNKPDNIGRHPHMNDTKLCYGDQLNAVTKSMKCSDVKGVFNATVDVLEQANMGDAYIDSIYNFIQT
jgi:hypothetical protein